MIHWKRSCLLSGSLLQLATLFSRMLGCEKCTRIVTHHVVIRDFERKDAEALYRIVHEQDIVRFMRDWLQTQKDSTDVRENKRYAVALPDTDEMIGMVGMGLEDTLNEVEVAYGSVHSIFGIEDGRNLPSPVALPLHRAQGEPSVCCLSRSAS